MSIDPITAGVDLITTIISRVWPDKTAQEKAILAAALAADENLTKILTGQLAVNAAEATHDSIFVAGWRPSVGWVCSAAFAWQFVVMPILAFISVAAGHPIPVPTFDISTMVTVLMGMLGIGGLRTYEKIKKTNNG